MISIIKYHLENKDSNFMIYRAYNPIDQHPLDMEIKLISIIKVKLPLRQTHIIS